MSILSRTAGKNKRPIRRALIRRLVFILAAAFLAYEVGIAAASLFYVDGLLEPGCDSARNAVPGYEDLSVPTAAGYTLPAWWRAGTNGTAVILLPGNGGSRDTLLPDAELLASHGYAVLSLSPRACAGLRSTLGLREAADLQSAAALLARQPGVDWIAVLGFSAGGTAAILGAVDTPQIRAVIAEGHFRSLDYEIENSRPASLSTEWQVQRWIELWYRLRSGAWPTQVSPIDALPALQPRPVLLIFGEREAGNAAATDQFAAAGPTAELWIVPGAGHGGYLQSSPREYEARLLDFLENARRLP